MDGWMDVQDAVKYAKSYIMLTYYTYYIYYTILFRDGQKILNPSLMSSCIWWMDGGWMDRCAGIDVMLSNMIIRVLCLLTILTILTILYTIT